MVPLFLGERQHRILFGLPKNNKIAVWTTVIAFFFGNTLMFCFGAIGGAFTGADDIFYVMIAQGLAIPAIIVLGSKYLDNK